MACWLIVYKNEKASRVLSSTPMYAYKSVASLRIVEDFYSENVRRNRSMREDVRIAKQLEREDKSIAAVSREMYFVVKCSCD